MSKILDAIAEVSFGGIFPFGSREVAFQLSQSVHSIKKRMKKLEVPGVIEPFEVGLYPTFFFIVSEDWAEKELFVEKRKQLLDKIRKNFSENKAISILPEPIPDEVAGKVWDVRGNPIKTDS